MGKQNAYGSQRDKEPHAPGVGPAFEKTKITSFVALLVIIQPATESSGPVCAANRTVAKLREGETPIAIGAA